MKDLAVKGVALVVSLALLVAVGFVLVLSRPIASGSGSAGLSALYVDAQEPIVEGYHSTAYLKAGPDWTFSASVNSAKQIKIVATSSQGTLHDWYVQFGGPSNTLVSTGPYEVARSFGASGRPYLYLHQQNTVCGGGWVGRFVVTELNMTGTSTVNSFAANFEMGCEGGNTAILGQISFNASAGMSALMTNAESSSFAPAGAPQTFTISNVGTTSQTIGASLGGPFPEAFSILSNDCAVLAAGEACHVQVKYVQPDAYPRPAELLLTDQTPRGTRTIQLMGQPIR